jgi:hypothetical protein
MPLTPMTSPKKSFIVGGTGVVGSKEARLSPYSPLLTPKFCLRTLPCVGEGNVRQPRGPNRVPMY